MQTVAKARFSKKKNQTDLNDFVKNCMQQHYINKSANRWSVKDMQYNAKRCFYSNFFFKEDFELDLLILEG